MVGDPAERECRAERRGRDKCRRNKEKRRRGRRKQRTVRRAERRRTMRGGGGRRRLHSSTLPLVRGFLDGARASREGRKKVEGGGEERDGGKGEGPLWLLSASHVSKPVLKNE